jgi:hypothetical protein
MTLEELLEVFKKNGSRNINYMLGSISLNKGILHVYYGGNMSSSIESSVNPMLKGRGFPSINTLKKSFKLIKEDGDPSYMYEASFRIIT